jgi:hypothetical protein
MPKPGRQTPESTYFVRNSGSGVTLAIVFALVGSAGAVNAATTVAPSSTSAPTISGTVQEGQTLTANKGAWSGTEPITYAYAWQRCDSSGGHCSNIKGATEATYTLKKPDVDRTLRVAVTAKNADVTNSATSVPTAVVKAAMITPPQSVTLSASTLRVVYGTAMTLSGTVSTKQAGESVTVGAQRFEGAKFTTTVTTGSGGAWSYSAKPTIQTSYRAHWKNATSSSLTVGVMPLVAFRVLTGRRFSTRVVAARSFAGRIVQFQRRSSLGQWVTVKRLRLNASSASIFRSSLPKGTSKLRVAISVNQAGAGYLGGISRTIVYRRS